MYTLFIKAVFDAFNNSNVSYVVLRNYQNLPTVVEHDIDLLVAPSHLTLAEQLLTERAVASGWTLAMNAKRYAFRTYTFVRIGRDSEMQSLQWDVWSPLTWKGIPWIDSQLILDTRRRFSEFYIPTAGAEAAILCMKDVIQVGAMRRKYQARIQELSSKEPDLFKHILKPFWKDKLTNWLFDAIQDERWIEIEQRVFSNRWLLLAQVSKQPLHVLRSIAGFLSGHISARVFSPKGCFVSLIGPDGSGKSTVSVALSDRGNTLFCSTRYFHGRFGILPSLSELAGRQSPSNRELDEECSPLSSREKPSRHRMLLYLIYYGLDFLLGHFIVLRARTRNELIVSDRYFYDYVIQPGPITGDNVVFRILLRLIPKPDHIFYLYAPPETVHSRKPELNVAQIKRQEQVCMALEHLLPNLDVIDNSHSLDYTLTQILTKMIQPLTRRGCSHEGPTY